MDSRDKAFAPLVTVARFRWMFEGFEKRRVSTVESSVFVRIGGAGPSLLLLHGFPETHLVMWDRDGALENWYTDQGGPVGIWKKWAKDVRGKSMAGGHFFPEAEPMATADELRAFFLGES